MPVPGSTGNFDDECATTDVKFPESTLSEFTKGANEVFEHDGEISFIGESESEKFETVPFRRIHVIDYPVETSANPS